MDILEKRERQRQAMARWRLRHPDKVKEQTERYKERHRISGRLYYQNNKIKLNNKSKGWWKSHSEWTQQRNLRKKYGITLEEWHKMLIEQSGCCGLCYEPFENNKSLGPSVDHNHKTKKVRELLHFKCNTGIGNFDEDINKFKKAIDYIERHTLQEIQNDLP